MTCLNLASTVVTRIRTRILIFFLLVQYLSYPSALRSNILQKVSVRQVYFTIIGPLSWAPIIIVGCSSFKAESSFVTLLPQIHIQFMCMEPHQVLHIPLSLFIPQYYLSTLLIKKLEPKEGRKISLKSQSL